GEEALRRLQLGYHGSLRHSSIRPDLPLLFRELLEAGLTSFENVTMTTDGATPAFYEHGMMNRCIAREIEEGVPIAEAYQMVTFQVARHYNMEEQIGSTGPGRMAHINILQVKDNPDPVSVLAKGQWIVRENKEQSFGPSINWREHDIEELALDWELDDGDLQ